MKNLFTSTAVIEGGTGLALLGLPALVVQLLLGAEISGAAIPLGRVGGAALLALAVACWLARGDSPSASAKGLVAAMLTYNLCAVAVLANAGVQTPTAGALLWLVVIVHAAMAVWCALCFFGVTQNLRGASNGYP
jgi:hypothetical protein